jgi:hypothetical protein
LVEVLRWVVGMENDVRAGSTTWAGGQRGREERAVSEGRLVDGG